MSRRSRRNSIFGCSGFSLRRLLLQGARVARGSPTLGQRSCDLECDNVNLRNSKHDKKNGEGTSAAIFSKNNAIENSSITSSKYNNSHATNTNYNNNNNNGGLLQQQNSVQSDDSSYKFPQQSKNNSYNSPQRSESMSTSNSNEKNMYCLICYNNPSPPNSFFTLSNCNHNACKNCLQYYLTNEINESRTDIACPICSEAMHPSNIETLLKDSAKIIGKYEDFMVRRFLLTDPDSRWCPAPDCSYAVIASGCASCPRIQCKRPGCGLHFCYHCKAQWHPDQTCDAARASRQNPLTQNGGPSNNIDLQGLNSDDIKPCPRCQVLIAKMDDGSCNHMVCSICGSEFCWLCMKEISDLHYLSPSGCTFWGKKPWSRKKKLMWQLGTLVGAPLGIGLVAGIAVPSMIIGIPIWVANKIYVRYKNSSKHKRNCAILSGVVASILVSPILAGLAVAIGVPILLFYVYGVVPISLCRAGCDVSSSRDGFKFEFDEEDETQLRNQSDGASVDAVSRIGATSIGEVSLSVASGSHIVGVSGGTHSGCTIFGAAQSLSSNRESTTALAGSITGHRLEVQADVSLSETASAVTCISEKSGNISNDTASTKALAGSILSYRQQTDNSNISEDGVSERFQIIDGNTIDHDLQNDKVSVGSSRSFRGSERSYREDLEATTTSSSSSIKRFQFCARHTKPNPITFRTISLDSNNGTNYIPENVKLEKQAEEEDLVKNTNIQENKYQNDDYLNKQYTNTNTQLLPPKEIHFVEGTIYNEKRNNFLKLTPINQQQLPVETSTSSSSLNIQATNKLNNSPDKKQNPPSKATILRNLFFAQKNDNSSHSSSTSQLDLEQNLQQKDIESCYNVNTAN